MILNTITLEPFAGIKNRTLNFAPGLNVVLGPNEAGKSTIVNALRSVLFVSTKLTDAQLKRSLKAFLPVEGGDTIRVTLTFLSAGKRHTIRKSWGGTRSCAFSSEGSGERTDPGLVDASLQKLLRFHQGTFDNVLITAQSSLARTVDDLRSADDVRTSFADILRASVFEAGGVSADRLLALMKDHEKQYFSRWDTGTDGPEAGKGIQSRWIKEVGLILERYYALKECERDLLAAEQYELKIDEYARTITIQESEVRTLERYVEASTPIVQDARTRLQLELNRKVMQQEIAEMKTAQSGWPRNEARIEFLTGAIAGLTSRLSGLQREQASGVEFQKQKLLRDTYGKALPLRHVLTEEERMLGTLREIKEPDLMQMTRTAEEIKLLKARLTAQKVSLDLLSKKGIEAVFQAVLKDPVKIVLKPEEKLHETAEGRFVLDHEDWTLTVSAGTGDLQSMLVTLGKLQTAFEALLRQYDVPSVEEATKHAETYKNQKKRVDTQRAAFQAVLGNESFGAIEARVNVLPSVTAGRSNVEIVNELTQTSAEISTQRAALTAAETEIAGWEKKYEDQETLQNRLLERLGEQKRIDAQLSELKPLPEGVTDANGFVTMFEKKSTLLISKREELFRLQINRKEYEKNEPVTSREDLRVQVEEKKKAFERARQEGAAYRRMRVELESILKMLDRDTFTPYQARVEQMLTGLTSGRHTKVRLENALPVEVRGEGGGLSLDLLSAGTRDVLALAVRFGMAAYSLEGSDGFLVMDDPLVNLDPHRQGAAAECIHLFARDRQVIVLTCHPSHARLLGGSEIKLE
jgi:DNA repair protein SbcC/Rad50